MSETDRQIQELYTQYRAGKLHAKQREQSGYEISELLRDRPGSYSLARLSYISHITGSGFIYGFDYSLGEDVFEINYWSYNDWGILVQKHPKDYIPEIEIVETEEPMEDELTEDPEVDAFTTINRLLHLPEGFRIPVGPLRFESDSLPMNEEELAANKSRVIEIAKAAGIKISRYILKTPDKFSGPARKYPHRYFYWQPILPDNPTRITIDFDAIEPYHMGLTLENAPTFNNTLVITDDL